MAEGRMLRKKVSRDGRVAQLSVHSALLYLMAIPHLDVDGRLDGSPIAVRGIVVPALVMESPHEWTDESVHQYILEWTGTTDEDGTHAPLVLRYCIGGVWACQFTGFTKNQKLRRDREAPSTLPAPPESPLDALGMPAPEPVDEGELLRLSMQNRSRAQLFRARAKNAHAEPVDLYAVAERDGWRCHICGEQIVKMTGTSSKSLSFDHIVPGSQGGEHVAENIAPAHFGCNAGKCDRIRVSVPSERYAGQEAEAEAEAEVQVQEPPDQRGMSRARGADGAALLGSGFSGKTEDQVTSGILEAVARRKDALDTHGPLGRLLEVLPDADDRTPAVLHSVFDGLPPEAIEHARREILDAGPRRPSAYAVGIGRRLAART